MTLYGWDMSHYDAPSIGDAIAEGFGFITHKAGGDATDPELAAWWSGIKGQRLMSLDQQDGKALAGAYWVLYPGNPTGRADAFLAQLDAKCPGWRQGPFLLQLDCEIWNNDQGTKPGVGDINAFCDRLVAKAAGLRPMVYASKGQYGDSLKGLRYPLWNANYPSSMTGPASSIYEHVGGDSGVGWHTYSGQTPAIWQFTSSATIAGQTTCDANAFRGTLADIVQIVAPGYWKQKEEDMNADEMTAWADKYFARTYQDTANTQITSKIGRDALDQYIPNPFRNVKTTAWQLQSDIAAGVVALQAAVNPSALAAALAPLLPDGVEITDQQLESAFINALKQMAATEPEPTA